MPLFITLSQLLLAGNLASLNGDYGVAFPACWDFFYREFWVCIYSEFCILSFVLSVSHLPVSSYTAMPPSCKSQKKERFVVNFILACTFLTCAHLISHSSHRDQNATSLPKKWGLFYYFFSSNNFFDTFTARNVLLQLSLLLPTAATLPHLMPFSPNALKQLWLAVLNLMLCPLTISCMLYVHHHLSTCSLCSLSP